MRMSVETSGGEEEEAGVYMTRCKFERRIPPLKSESAAPILQTAYPGIGLMNR